MINPRPYVVARTYYMEASNPAPAASILLTNPAENRVALKYTLNGGAVQLLQAGFTVQLNRVSVIEFDRGGGAGRARYSLTDGAYKFTSTNGYWDLFRDTAPSNEAVAAVDVAANPLPAK